MQQHVSEFLRAQVRAHAYSERQSMRMQKRNIFHIYIVLITSKLTLLWPCKVSRKFSKAEPPHFWTTLNTARKVTLWNCQSKLEKTTGWRETIKAQLISHLKISKSSAICDLPKPLSTDVFLQKWDKNGIQNVSAHWQYSQSADVLNSRRELQSADHDDNRKPIIYTSKLIEMR